MTSTADCERIASDLNHETILAIDCQGFYRGSRLKLTLLQIGTYKGDVYLFDVYTNKDLLSNNHLKHLLESENIEKVCNVLFLYTLVENWKLGNKMNKNVVILLPFWYILMDVNLFCRSCLNAKRLVVHCTTIFKLLWRTSLI